MFIQRLYELIFFLVGVFSLLNLLVLFSAYLLTPFRKRKYADFEPKISIIIPTYNEEKVIEKCLNSVFLSNYDAKKIEVICADDGSLDQTRTVILNLKQKFKNLKLYKFDHCGKASALNRAAKKVSSGFIVGLDADMTIDSDALKNIVAPMQDPKVGSSFAKIDVLLKNKLKLVEYFQGVEFFYMNLVRIACTSMFNYPMWFSGQFVCYRVDTLKKVKWFSPELLIEDFDISLKIFSHDYKSVYVKNAVGHTQPMDTTLKLIKQRMRWFYGGIQTLIKNRKLLDSGSIVPLYIYFSYVVWLLNSLIVFPGVIYTMFWSLQFGLLKSLFFIIENNTFFTTFNFWMAVTRYQNLDLTYFTYGTIGTLLFTLYSLSLIFVGKRINPQIIIAFFTIFMYILFLQGCTILAMVYYPIINIKTAKKI